jgi:hypothetical protein
MGRWARAAALAAVAAIALGAGLLTARAMRSSTTTVIVGPVVDLQVQSFDLATGAIRLAVTTLRQAKLEGTLDSSGIQRALAAALQGDTEAGPRLAQVDVNPFVKSQARRLLETDGQATPFMKL